MKTIEKTTAEPLDIVVKDGFAYRVEARIPRRRCASQCHMFDKAAGLCNGYCWRFDNVDDICFRRLLPVSELKADAVVVVTPMWRLHDEAAEEALKEGRNAYFRQRRDKMKAEEEARPRKHPGRRSDGSTYKERSTYRADITIKGVRYRASFPTRAEAMEWIAGIKAEKGVKQ